MSEMAQTMRTLELEEENKRLRQGMTMYRNGMLDLLIMLQNDEAEEALAKLHEFLGD